MNDAVNVQVWLPESSSWNGKLQAVGGGGYSASFDGRLGKGISESYYGTKPKRSYFTGCSGGGRQGMMLAQKHGDDFDGIMTAAPAINAENFLPAGYWATQVMLDLGVAPARCEVEAFTQAAIDACDALDGAEDGIISLPALCTFDPHSIVGKNFSCNGTEQQYTDTTATIVQAAWTGARSDDGKVGWFGIHQDAALTSMYITTECTSNGTCTAAPADLFSGWVQYFLAKDPNWDASTMTKEVFLAYLQESETDYGSIVAADNPDLSAFRASGGKIITWHGLADEAIPPNGTIAYMEQVLKANPQSDEFIRFYEAPGVGHCYGGAGAAPDDALAQLVLWVENGTVPETLAATDSTGRQRELCTFPLQQVYLGGNLSDSASFGCGPRSEVGTPASDLPFYQGT
ncbi:hypothetical protein ACHAQA_002579 [Verticillium albo-atrum]